MIFINLRVFQHRRLSSMSRPSSLTTREESGRESRHQSQVVDATKPTLATLRMDALFTWRSTLIRVSWLQFTPLRRLLVSFLELVTSERDSLRMATPSSSISQETEVSTGI